MFANDIIESGAFLEMPHSSQILYVHLCMHADDDGFVSNPKQIAKMIDATNEDIELLLAKRFILSVESNKSIVVIKHWLINNNIRADRKKDTVYTAEKTLLFVKPNRAYTLDRSKGKSLFDTSVGIPNDNQMTTKRQPSIGKVSKVDKLDKKDKIGGLPNFNYFTKILIKSKYIDEYDLEILEYDRFLSELACCYSKSKILSAIKYFLDQMKFRKAADDKLNYFKVAITNGLNKLTYREQISGKSIIKQLEEQAEKFYEEDQNEKIID